MVMTSIMSVLIIAIDVTMGLTPLYSRRSNLFGITIPSSLQNDPDIKKMGKRFIKGMLWLNVPLCLPLIVFNNLPLTKENEMIFSGYLGLAILLIFIVYFILYADTRKKLICYLSQKNVSNSQSTIRLDLNFRQNLILVSNWLIVGINCLILLVGVVYTLLTYSKIPSEIPTNFNFQMEPDAFVSKSPLHVMTMPILQLFLLGVFVLTNRGFKQAKQQLASEKTSIYLANDMKFRRISSIGLLISSIFIQILLTMIQVVTVTPDANYGLLLPVVIWTLVGTIGINLYLGIKYRQSGEQLTPNINFDMMKDDKFWKFGLIYWNTNDPSIWVEKKVGTGLSLNFAHWQSWFLLVVVIVFPIVMIAVLGN
ncbi:hypothetical protein BW732_00780 [Vagococcus penaei]|uniref:DUF5808 domain-containing protein n=1 Tax=Vagococcus penaei TaxID=633807 RepID=A0A1Q2D3K4_9ENTE|nr:DUF1648 domain-containing protein [Vagococcus penaei]AQP52901.1 hypothetical protein BW732_00780 [Vagococcus penaei]